MPDEPVERVRAVFERVLDELELKGNVDVSEDSETISASVEGDDD